MINPYLTQEEYNSYGFAEISEPFSFANLLMRSSLVLDNATRNFYHFNDINEDWEWRVDKFKKAIALQIEYFVVNNAVSTSEMNDRPLSVTLGRTTVSRGGKGQTVDNSEVSLICPDVYMVLEGTGLLFRGVESC